MEEMPSIQFGGPIGPFLDRVQQRQVPVSLHGSCDYTTSFAITDPAGLDNHIRNALLGATHHVISGKMASGQLTFRNLGEGTLGGTEMEIVQATGLAQQGIQLANVVMRFGIDGHPPYQPPQPQAQPSQAPEVRAKIRVEGVNINVSSTGGLDTKGLGNQLVNKAKSAILWYVGFAVLAALIVGGTIWYLKRTVKKAVEQPSASAAAASKWDGKSPLTCTGSDEVTITGVTAKLDGTAVTASGGCKLTLENVDITAPKGIEAGGNAIVTVTGGSITATDMAAQALGNAQVTFKGTKVSGKTKALGGAKITGP